MFEQSAFDLCIVRMKFDIQKKQLQSVLIMII